MKELTYILGAGASYQSMPVVKTFAERFTDFQDYLTVLIEEIKLKDTSNKTDAIIRWGKELEIGIRTHQSFDTFFKKKFHLGKTTEIVNYKKIINLYFLWEHLHEIKIDSHEDLKGISFVKTTQIDKRYDALIASLLKPKAGKTELFCKVNFLSWNYDLNLLSSIKQYFNPLETYSELLQELQDKSRAEWLINDILSVVNMNGHFYSHLFDQKKDLEELDKELLLKEAVQAWARNLLELQTDATRIRFAWEGMSENPNNNLKHVELAVQKIKRSDAIVIIGYTFPLYNRLIDLQYINLPSLRKGVVYIQDPDANIITTRVREEFSLIDTYVTIKPITDCNSFYVPRNIVDIQNL